MYTYSVNDETFEVSVSDSDGVVVLLQPTWPNGEAWASAEQAQAWADQLQAFNETTDSDMPGPSPEQPAMRRIPAPPANIEAFFFDEEAWAWVLSPAVEEVTN